MILHEVYLPCVKGDRAVTHAWSAPDGSVRLQATVAGNRHLRVELHDAAPEPKPPADSRDRFIAEIRAALGCSDADDPRKVARNLRDDLAKALKDPIPKQIVDFFEGRPFERASGLIDANVDAAGRRLLTETVTYREIVFPPFVSVPIMSASPGATGNVSITDGTGTRTAKIEDGKVGEFTTIAQEGWTNIGLAKKTLNLDGLAPGQTFNVKIDGLPVKINNPSFAAFLDPSLGEPFDDGEPVTPTPAPALKRPCTICNLAEARYFPVYSGALCHACARAKLPPLEAVPRRWPKIVAAVVGVAAAVGGVVAAWGAM